MTVTEHEPLTETDALPVAQIRADGGTQMRAGLQDAAITEYADALREGQTLPPITVYHDGDAYWLADGFHRLAAHKRAHTGGTIRAIVKPGTRRDAILHAAGANSEHGLRRTQADKRRAVEALLADPEWGKWSDREIARRCKVDHKTVGAARRELSGEIPQMQEPRLAQRGGTTYPMRTRSRERPEPSKPVYAERPPDPSTPDDVRAAGYVIESHWSGWYHWKVANPHGPGATFGVLYETPAEAIDEAREDIALGMTYYPEPEPAEAEPEAPQADPQPVYAKPDEEGVRLRKENAELNRRIESHVYSYERDTAKLRDLLPGDTVVQALRVLLDAHGQDKEHRLAWDAIRRWLDRLENER